MRVACFVGFMLSVAGLQPATAACVSDGQGPCYRYWRMDVVVLGEVTEKVLIEKVLFEKEYLLGKRYMLRVAVMEAFRGVAASEASIVVESYDGECGFDAEVGEQVFIYGLRGKDGTLGATMQAQRLEDADADLSYARLARSNAASTMVYGEVVQREDSLDEDETFKSLSGVQVRVRGVVAPRGLASRWSLPDLVELATAKVFKGQVTALPKLVAPFSSSLTFVTLDFTGLPADEAFSTSLRDGVISAGQRELTVATERGASITVYRHKVGGTSKTTVAVVDGMTRVRLSDATWTSAD